LQGFAGRAATSTMRDATEIGVSISGIFQAAEDLTVLAGESRTKRTRRPVGGSAQPGNAGGIVISSNAVWGPCARPATRREAELPGGIVEPKIVGGRTWIPRAIPVAHAGGAEPSDAAPVRKHRAAVGGTARVGGRCGVGEPSKAKEGGGRRGVCEIARNKLLSGHSVLEGSRVGRCRGCRSRSGWKGQGKRLQRRGLDVQSLVARRPIRKSW
jgi:hypothetical protein